MRWPLIAALFAAACSGGSQPIGSPLLRATTAVEQTAAYSQRRGQLEVYVKTNFTAMLADIRAGEGPILDNAMTIAGIPAGDRPTRIIQLQSDVGLYAAAPGALITALMIYGS
jgi:hypothetical protein